MRIIAPSVRALAVAIGAACIAALAGTAVRAQVAAINLLNVYEQASASTCVNTPGCRVDFIYGAEEPQSIEGLVPD
jgi:hypothetical protein